MNKALLVNAFMTCLGGLWQRLVAIAGCFWALTLLLPGELGACPAFLDLQRDLGGLRGKRAALRLYAYQGAKGSWQRLPLQIDLISSTGALIFPGSKLWQEEDFGGLDRLVVRPEHFAAPKPPGVSLPCKAKEAFELSRHGVGAAAKAYLVLCEEAMQEPDPPAPLVYLPEKRLLYSELYSYEFGRTNHMLFEQIALGAGQQRAIAAFSSDMLIYSPIKNLATLRFDSGSIQSQIGKTLAGPVGMNANVSFFLKILFLKLKLSLTTDVSFYGDSAYIPMVLYLPVNAASYLHSHSGILYHWALGEAYDRLPSSLHMPRLDAQATSSLLSQGAIAPEVTKNHCQEGKPCHFRYEMAGAKNLIMEFMLDRSLVSHGFYPYYVDDIAQGNSRLSWELNLKPGSEKRRGVYFATAGLRQGSHRWDFWLRLGGDKASATTCPQELHARKLARKP